MVCAHDRYISKLRVEKVKFIYLLLLFLFLLCIASSFINIKIDMYLYTPSYLIQRLAEKNLFCMLEDWGSNPISHSKYIIVDSLENGIISKGLLY